MTSSTSRMNSVLLPEPKQIVQSRLLTMESLSPLLYLDQVMASHPSAAKSALNAPSDASLRVPCYCEENVWRLAFRKLWNDRNSGTPTNSSNKYFVLFVSNPKGCVPMFQQLASAQRDGDKPIFWDYHVILLEATTSKSGTRIWDIDSRLECPISLKEYVSQTFPRHEKWLEDYQPFFRVVDALVFLQHFSSDRSHMIVNGQWSAPPPEYDCIINRDSLESNQSATNVAGKQLKNGASVNTLKEYMTISKADAIGSSNDIDWGQNGVRKGIHETSEDKRTHPFGAVCTLTQLQQWFGG